MIPTAEFSVRACIVLGALLGTTRASAFSDQERFQMSAKEGGGDDRMFTGSPRDAYTCNVCHVGGREPQVIVYGLPLAGYVPGQTYPVEIGWDNAGVSHALHVEIVDPVTGRAAGLLRQVDIATIDARGRCGSLPTEDRADYVLNADNRQVLGVANCGASNVRFQFTAPDAAEVIFAGSVVRAGEPKASSAGDGVQDLRRVLRRVGEPNNATSSCGVAAVRGHHAGCAWGICWLLLVALGIRVVSRHYRNFNPNMPVSSRTSTDGNPMKFS